MKLPLIILLLLSGHLFALDAAREDVLKELIQQLENTKAQQLKSAEKYNNPQLNEKMMRLFDEIKNDLKKTANTGKINPDSHFGKKLSDLEKSLQSAKDKGKKQLVESNEQKIKLMKWLVSDPSVTTQPETVVLY